MKIAIITDIHHAPPDAGRDNALDTVRRCVAAAADAGADLLLDLGDRIEDFDAAVDRRLLDEVAACFEAFEGPRVHLDGNHDVVNLTPADNAARLAQPVGHRSIDLGDTRLLVWQPSVVFTRPVGFAATGGDLDWLVGALEADNRPAIIASHLPVSGASMTGNYYFANNPVLATYPDAARIRAAVEETGRAALWLSGHVHWNSLTSVGGVRHLTIQSVSETFVTPPEAARAFAMLEIGDGTAVLEVFGGDPLRLTVPFRASGERRWLAPRPAIS